MRRVLIALAIVAGFAFSAAPAVAQEADSTESPSSSETSPPPVEETTPPPPAETTPPPPVVTTPPPAGEASGGGDSTPEGGGSTPGSGGSTPGESGATPGAGGLPPGPEGLPPGTGSTAKTGIPPISISALDALAAEDVGILADSEFVRLCHRTNSDDNPYTNPESATAGVANGHDKEHNGPIWNPTLKDLKIEWGDVIEPYTYDGVNYPGQNWDESFYNAGCNPSTETILVTAEPPTATDPTCEEDGALVLPTTEGVSYSSNPGGTGPGTYTVTATAEPGYEINGQTEFEITVRPQRTGDQCIEHPGDSTDVKICHRTNSNENPYNVIPPATAGVANGHDEEHEGPIWDPTLKDLGIEWGDIIEPYTFNGQNFPGQNWEEGEAIFNNGCIPDFPPEECPEDSEEEECEPTDECPEDSDEDSDEGESDDVQTLDDDEESDEECDEDEDEDGDDPDKAALLPDTGGTSLWTLLMGGILTVLGMAIISNRESMGRIGLFGPVPLDAPSVPWSYTIGRDAGLPVTVVKLLGVATPGRHAKR